MTFQYVWMKQTTFIPFFKTNYFASACKISVKTGSTKINAKISNRLIELDFTHHLKYSLFIY